MKIYPVILSGGSGSRLWPLSRASRPKQLLPLASEKTMIQETALRLTAPEFMPPLIVCGEDHRFSIAEQLREVGVKPIGILLEPAGRNTAPATAAAAHFLKVIDEQAVMLVLPADHVIRDVSAFQAAVQTASAAVEEGALATFGIVPTAPETGYGYICRGREANNTKGCFRIERFVEKPDLPTAESFIRDGNYLWNSGIFLFRASDYLAELDEHNPEMVLHSAAAVRNAYRDLDFCRLEESSFEACPSDSIDYAMMEHTRKGIVVAADIGWSDVGSWSALLDISDVDSAGNSSRGDVYMDNVRDSLIRAESRMVAAIGVQGVVIVETADAVLVVARDAVQDVKKVVDELKRSGRNEHAYHTEVFRPWGSYEGIDAGHRYQVKRIMVKPGEKLSLQMHHHRAEHWIVVSGTARVTCGEEVKLLRENESTYIPLGSVHRLENPGKIPLHIVEVQSGAYLKEDDIVRFEDIYKRA